ncbi:hypothetical protein EKO27_g6746 [Xylaria grammica]|uniref:SET domain-containing protein n=1 Tax=Xylaria grammica TaxID=363999 RepID=A0A439D1M9_9PEZI|nr:hypothetical protein EKO27_g6746 [Xylaria grammica]
MPPVRLCDSEMGVQGPGLVEVRATSSMGNGLFATHDISRGTRVIAEVPILAISNVSSLEQDILERDLPAFCAALQHLPQADLQNLGHLHCNGLHNTTEMRQKVRQWYRDRGTTDANGDILKGKKLQDFAKSTAKRFAIFLSNRVEMSTNETDGSGVFPLHSRMNHSCIPNTHSAYNASIQRLTTHAIRDIQAGEQLTTSYLETLCQVFQQRKRMIERDWGFVCGCHACTDLSDEPLRRRMSELGQRLLLRRFPLTVTLGLPVARDDHEALRDAEELVALLEHLGLEGMDLRRMYRACSNYNLDLGFMQGAVQYAQKELELERCMLGTDTAHLQGEMGGAEFWLQLLQRLNN